MERSPLLIKAWLCINSHIGYQLWAKTAGILFSTETSDPSRNRNEQQFLCHSLSCYGRALSLAIHRLHLFHLVSWIKLAQSLENCSQAGGRWYQHLFLQLIRFYPRVVKHLRSAPCQEGPRAPISSDPCYTNKPSPLEISAQLSHGCER